MFRGQHMAQILSFRTPELRNGRNASRQQGDSAQVILFPGIRYERWADRDQSPNGDQRAATRDVIELADQ